MTFMSLNIVQMYYIWLVCSGKDLVRVESIVWPESSCDPEDPFEYRTISQFKHGPFYARSMPWNISTWSLCKHKTRFVNIGAACFRSVTLFRSRGQCLPFCIIAEESRMWQSSWILCKLLDANEIHSPSKSISSSKMLCIEREMSVSIKNVRVRRRE